MAKWLRRWTDDLKGALSVGSNPGTIDFFVLNFFMMERRAAAQKSARRDCRRAGMSTANVGTSVYLYRNTA